MEVKPVPLSDENYFIISRGKTLSRQGNFFEDRNAFVQDRIPYLVPADLRNPIISQNSRTRYILNENGYQAFTNNIIPPKSILICRNGPLLGKISRNTVRCSIDTGLTGITVKDTSSFLPDYVAIMLLSMNEQIKLLAEGRQFGYLRISFLVSLTIPLVDLDKQQEIINRAIV